MAIATKSFFENRKYKILKGKLDYENRKLLIELVGEAIGYGMNLLSKNLKQKGGD